MSEVLSVWKLRTHPFSSPMDDKGVLLPNKVLFATLNPTADQRLLRLYFNLYNWEKSASVSGLDREKVLSKFPDEVSLKESNGLLILIVGGKSEGRESLQNLILHKINLEHGVNTPVLIKATLDGQDQVENVKLIARNFLRRLKREIEEDDYKDLDGLFTAETASGSLGTNSVFANLFVQLHETVSDYYNKPFVLLLSGGDHNDTWETVYNSTRHLFQYIIVVTNDETRAESVGKHLPSNSVAIIKAQRLDLPKTKVYLQTRLTAERIGTMTPEFALAPFGDEALQTLFGPGSQAVPNQPVQLPIGRLNKILNRIIDLHLNEVVRIAQEQNKPLDQIDLKDTLVSADTVLRAMQSV